MSDKQRGYSLPEMLTVVAIMGMIVAVGIPAFMVLMPQYRVRSAASELAATVRRTRQAALMSRRPWRITFDSTGNRYTVSELNAGLAAPFNPSSPAATALQTPGNWIPVDQNLRPTGAFVWTTLPSSIILSTSNLYDVDCANGTDLIYLFDGSVAADYNVGGGCGAAGGTAALTVTGSNPAKVRLHYNSNLVTFNTYYVNTPSLAGDVRTAATKE